MGSLLKKYGWYEWICHTNFSFLVGASHPYDYVARAAELGYRGLAVTDYDGAYGLARAYRALKQIEKGGSYERINLFYGAEVHLAKDHHLPLTLQDTVILIAQSHKGYFNLCRLLTRSHKEGKHDAHVLIDDLFRSDVSDLVVIGPMRGLIRRERPAIVAQRWQALKEHFKDRCYLAITRLLNQSEDYWIESSLEIARRYDIPLLLSQDAYMHERSQKKISDVLHAMRLNEVVDDVVGQMFVNAERSLHSMHPLEKLYASIPGYEQALKNSCALAESCQFDFSQLRYSYPKEMIPSGYDAQSYLEEMSWSGARRIYGECLPEKIIGLLHKELDLIRHLGFADYFLTVWDIVRWAREQSILCQGRGSAANSVICYVLGVTAVDPNLFDLLFERFLSVERGDPPDIDVDFEHERREEVIQYIYGRYGRQRAAMVANVVSFKTRGAIRFVGKALGISNEMIDKTTEYLSVRQHRRQPLADIFKSLSQELKLDEALCVRFQAWAELSMKIRGFPRHLGIHSGGFVIAEKHLDWLVPQEPATMEGRSVVQWCKEDIEALGFFKIDVLALGMLTAIRKSFALIKTAYDRDLTLATIPQDDVPTYEMIQKADTVGVFQIESRAQMSMLPRLRPRVFYDLVIEVAIIRPGPIQGGLIHPYLRRRFGKEEITYAHPNLIPILKRTLGVPIFQEQVMRVAMEIGDFTPGEADELRRHMGSWQIKGDLTPWMERLVKGMRRRGIKEEFINQLIGQFKGFADYGFPESHSASFALLAYASSYLKCHYPEVFCVALLNSQPMGFYSPHALLRDVMRHQGVVLPICVQYSQWETQLEPLGPSRYGIRLGFHLVAGLNEKAAQQLTSERQRVGGRWLDLDHFLKNCGLFRADLSCLAAANALEVFGVDRRGSIWLAEAATFAPYYEDVNLWHQFPAESAYEKIQQDFRATSTTLGEHPSLIIKTHCWCFPTAQEELILAKDLAELPKAARKRYVKVFGMVLVRQAPPSAKGMVFFTLEDESGFINLVFTPQVYQRFHKLIHALGFLCVEGELQTQGEGHSVLVRTVYEPLIKRAEVIPLQPAAEKSDLSTSVMAPIDAARNYM